MTQPQFFQELEKGYAECVSISRKKNADYAGVSDPFANFRLCESLGVSLEQGILVRMSDKLMRIGNLLQREAQVKDERIEDTLNDLCNYSQILRVYLSQK